MARFPSAEFAADRRIDLPHGEARDGIATERALQSRGGGKERGRIEAPAARGRGIVDPDRLAEQLVGTEGVGHRHALILIVLEDGEGKAAAHASDASDRPSAEPATDAGVALRAIVGQRPVAVCVDRNRWIMVARPGLQGLPRGTVARMSAREKRARPGGPAAFSGTTPQPFVLGGAVIRRERDDWAVGVLRRRFAPQQAVADGADVAERKHIVTPSAWSKVAFRSPGAAAAMRGERVAEDRLNRRPSVGELRQTRAAVNQVGGMAGWNQEDAAACAQHAAAALADPPRGARRAARSWCDHGPQRAVVGLDGTRLRMKVCGAGRLGRGLNSQRTPGVCQPREICRCPAPRRKFRDVGGGVDGGRTALAGLRLSVSAVISSAITQDAIASRRMGFMRR